MDSTGLVPGVVGGLDWSDARSGLLYATLTPAGCHVPAGVHRRAQLHVELSVRASRRALLLAASVCQSALSRRCCASASAEGAAVGSRSAGDRLSKSTIVLGSPTFAVHALLLRLLLWA